MGEKSKAGVLFCDIACKCICFSKDKAMIDSEEDDEDDLNFLKRQKTSNEQQYAFDIEMQRGVDTELVGRMQQYISGLKSIHKLPVEGLGLLNYGSEAEGIVKVYNYCEIDANSKEFKAKRIVGGKANLPIRTIYLGKVNGDVEIIFNGNELKDLGRSKMSNILINYLLSVFNNGYYGVGLLEDELKTIIATYERDGWIESRVLYKGATFDCANQVGAGIGALLLTGCSHKWIITLKKE